MTELPFLTAPGGKPPKRHRRHMDALLVHFAGMGKPLSLLAGPLYLKRQVPTLRKYARQLGLTFPDYTPRALKRKDT
jgi:hypothetical protein